MELDSSQLVQYKDDRMLLATTDLINSSTMRKISNVFVDYLYVYVLLGWIDLVLVVFFFLSVFCVLVF